MEFLQTARLKLRNFRPEDLQSLYAYRNHEACYRFQRWEDMSLSALSAFLADFREDVFLSGKEEQHYAIADGTDALVGELTCFVNPDDRCITLGITVSHLHQRRGYGFELLSAVVPALQAAWPSLELVALIEPENTGSIALFEKLGFIRECYAERIRSFVYTLPGIQN